MIVKSLDAQNKKRSAVHSLEQLAVPEYGIMCKLWDLCDDVFSGEQKVKDADKYVYRPTSKKGKGRCNAWAAYVGRGVMPDYAASTLEKMCGILASAPPEITLEGKAAKLDFMRENATPYHDGLDALADRVRRQIIRTGRYCLLLEPDESDEIGFHVNEYKCRKFLRARTVSSGGETYADLILLDTSKIVYDARLWRDVYYPQITLLALSGNSESAERVYYQAKFGEIGVPLAGYRNNVPLYADNNTYSLAMGAVFDMLEKFDVENPDAARCSELVFPTKYGRTLDRIPFVCINPGDLNFGDYWNPPLLKLCQMCLHILDSDCTYKTALFMTGDPQPVMCKTAKKDIQLGSDSILYVGDGDFKFVSPSGAGLAEQKAALDQMKLDAQQMGVSLAGQENMGNTPVGTMQLYRNSQTADLMRINQNCGKAIELILRYAGRWLGMTMEETSRDIAFKPSDEFAEIKATAQEAVTLIQSDVPMTLEEKRRYLEKNNIVDARPWDEVKEELDGEKAEKQSEALNSVAGAFGFAPSPDADDSEDQQQQTAKNAMEKK